MKCFDKHKEKIMKLNFSSCDLMHEDIFDKPCKGKCGECVLRSFVEFVKYLDKECVELTHDEYVILKNLTYGDILRRTDKGTLLCGYKGMYVPLKFNNLFGWLKNGDEYLIADLLESYEKEQRK